MRFCSGENVHVHEARAESLSELLSELASEVPALEKPGVWINTDLYFDTETNEYVATVYVH